MPDPRPPLIRIRSIAQAEMRRKDINPEHRRFAQRMFGLTLKQSEETNHRPERRQRR